MNRKNIVLDDFGMRESETHRRNSAVCLLLGNDHRLAGLQVRDQRFQSGDPLIGRVCFLEAFDRLFSGARVSL